MIIKRKLFTRAEKAAWAELHKATNGFRELPKGFENLGARDTIRLRRITGGLANWTSGKHNVDPEDLRLLAESLNLPETGKSGYKVINKYTNKELLERYKRIKATQKRWQKER